MVQCTSCGNKGFRVVLYTCRVCNKCGCPNCMANWKFLYSDLRPGEAVCSPQCIWRWIEGVFPSYRQSGLGEFSWASGLQTDVINMLDMKLAKTAEREGNYAEALRVYQFYYMDDEVQRLSELNSKEKVELVAKFKQSNAWINLVCPRCGALNRIGPEMREETIRSCFSCGMEYTDVILVFMMKKAMGLIPSNALLPKSPGDEDRLPPRL